MNFASKKIAQSNYDLEYLRMGDYHTMGYEFRSQEV